MEAIHITKVAQWTREKLIDFLFTSKEIGFLREVPIEMNQGCFPPHCVYDIRDMTITNMHDLGVEKKLFTREIKLERDA